MIQACTNLTPISLPKTFHLVVCTRGIFKGYVTTVQFLLEHGFGEPYHHQKHKVDVELSADIEESEEEGMWAGAGWCGLKELELGLGLGVGCS